MFISNTKPFEQNKSSAAEYTTGAVPVCDRARESWIGQGATNLYAYVGADPINKRDEKGLCASSEAASCDFGDSGLGQAIIDFKNSNLRLLLDRALANSGATSDVRSDACLHVDAGACGPLLPTTENVYWTLVEGVPRKIGEAKTWVEQCGSQINGAQATIGGAKGIVTAVTVTAVRDTIRGNPPKGVGGLLLLEIRGLVGGVVKDIAKQIRDKC